jgi:hypothetical protein
VITSHLCINEAIVLVTPEVLQKTKCIAGIIQRTVWWASRTHANGRQRIQRATCGLHQQLEGRTRLSDVPPDCPVCHERYGCNGRLRQKRKEITHYSLSGSAPDCPMRPRTEGNYGLPNGAPTTPKCLGAIKGTPRRMEQNTKHLLNILRCLDFTNMHLAHYVWDLSTFLSCDSDALCCVLGSWLVCVCVVGPTLALACVSIPSLTLVV